MKIQIRELDPVDHQYDDPLVNCVVDAYLPSEISKPDLFKVVDDWLEEHIYELAGLPNDGTWRYECLVDTWTFLPDYDLHIHMPSILYSPNVPGQEDLTLEADIKVWLHSDRETN